MAGGELRFGIVMMYMFIHLAHICAYAKVFFMTIRFFTCLCFHTLNPANCSELLVLEASVYILFGILVGGLLKVFLIDKT